MKWWEHGGLNYVDPGKSQIYWSLMFWAMTLAPDEAWMADREGGEGQQAT